jgi:hypothetical protein
MDHRRTLIDETMLGEAWRKKYMSIHLKDYVPTVESPPPDIRKLWFSDVLVKVMHDTKL